MGKVKINKDDKNRVLLTEVLPYEVPMIFSNEGFYLIVSNKQHETLLKRVKELSGVPYGIPFNFEIGKTLGGDSRTLSVIHPCFQLDFVELYEKYNSLMSHLCSKSPISLRKISKVARFYYSPNFVFDEDAHKNAEVEVEPEILDAETKYIKSYFTYKPIDLIYKFYDRMEFRRLEQRFNYMMTFDVSKCFYHIYTHSITWAVKDKASSKRNSRAKSFENDFDKIMQQSNYNETNGIVVGPEISRIFAEIILQRIDIDAIEVLVDYPIGLKYGVDYEVRRYVDDYFVFANDERNLQKIKDVFQDKLSYYKLYLNQSKADTKTSPFISDIHVAKREINQLLVSLFNKIIGENETDKTKSISIRKPYSVSQSFIKDFQCIAKRNNLTYDIISKDVVRFLKGRISLIFKSDKIIKEGTDFENFLLAIFDILLYCYSLNINANTTFKVAQAIVLVSKYFENNSNNQTKHAVFSKISQEIDNIFTDSKRKARGKNKSNIETLNILIALKKLGNKYLLTKKRIKTLFELDTEDSYDKLDYFQIITLLFYIENNSSYHEIMQNIEKSIAKKYSNDKDVFAKTELVLLFFDIICCPYISDKTKRNLISQTGFCNKGESIENKISDISNKKRWFVDWDTNIDLERILKKKEWGSSY
ncbi:MAG: RNA-directed DNA polymerase [Prevotellaceae bacterium]|jgi:hypothetical protein|nr:RNA-directed DNA polymerase [Prevotellaceae bacterium]